MWEPKKSADLKICIIYKWWKNSGKKKNPEITSTRHIRLTHLDGVGEWNGDSERKPFRNCDHQHRDANDEELDKVLNVDGCAFGLPLLPLHPERIDHKVQDENDDGHGRHDETCREEKQLTDSTALEEGNVPDAVFTCMTFSQPENINSWIWFY